MTYRETLARIDALHNALTARSAFEPPNEDDMKLMAIYARNCPEWVLLEHATYCSGGATVPLYDTLGPDTVEFVLKQTGASCCACFSDEEVTNDHEDDDVNDDNDDDDGAAENEGCWWWVC
jgi:long-chain acyl-CoA synthetase